MFSVVVTVIAIALFAAVMFAGSNYVDFDKIEQNKQATLVRSGFTQLGAGFTAYQNIFHKSPSAMADIIPEYTFTPVDVVTGTSWSYDTTTNKWFCLSGSISEVTYAAMKTFQNESSIDAVFINSACGASANMANPGSYPATVAMTYKVRP